VALHPQARAALAQWAEGPSVTDDDYDLAEQRRLARVQAATEPREPVARVEDVDADGVPCRFYRPDGADGVVVFLHGGGFVFGDLETHDAQSRRLANRTGRAVLTVDYRRPPEHRFPSAPDDVDTAVAWLLTHATELAVDPARVVALGDSAGGNLALVAALRNPRVFAATVLVYPFLDPRTGSASYRSEAGGLGVEEARWFWEQYAGPVGDLTDPDLAPLGSPHLAVLPPSLVVVAEHDPLVDEDVELARLLEAAGVATTLSTYPGMVHGFWTHPEQFDAAEESLAEIAAWLQRRL